MLLRINCNIAAAKRRHYLQRVTVVYKCSLFGFENFFVCIVCALIV